MTHVVTLTGVSFQMVQKFVLKKDPSFDITPLVRTQFTPGPELPVLFEER